MISKNIYKGMDKVGNWYKGYYVVRQDTSPVSETKEWYEQHLIVNYDFSYLDEKIVLKETICQCVGLGDCKGVLIFENDIIKYGEKTLTVEYKNGHFLLRIINTDRIYWFTDVYLYDLEVIGNVHADKKTNCHGCRYSDFSTNPFGSPVATCKLKSEVNESIKDGIYSLNCDFWSV